jgi:Amt family ammonium transporter
MLGRREHFPADMRPPHSPVLVMIGAALLWVGWYGFNAGSALSAGSSAGSAMLVTHLSASTAALVWMGIEWVKFGRPGLVGMVTGLIAGLATITPAAGSVGPIGAIIIGALASLVCFFAVTMIRNKIKLDDSLDVFAVHGVGGIMGSLLVAFLGAKSLGGAVAEPGKQFGTQLLGVGATAVWSVLGTLAVIAIIKATVGLRVSNDQENEGLDKASHSEAAYNFD